MSISWPSPRSSFSRIFRRLPAIANEAVGGHRNVELYSISLGDILTARCASSDRWGAKSTSNVTCCIPYGGGHPHLGRAIRSIVSQTVRPGLILVGVDGVDVSHEFISGLAGDIPLELDCSEHREGPFRTMERLIRKSAGEFILLQDSDDVSHPQRIELLLYMLKNLDVDLIGSAVVHFREEDGCVHSLDIFPPFPDVALRRQYCHAIMYPSIMFRRKVFEQSGGFLHLERFGMDSEFLLRAVSNCKSCNSYLPLYLKCRRAESLTEAAATGFGSFRRESVARFTERRYAELYGGLVSQ